MKISVIIPSKLDQAPDGELWAAKAVRSVIRQTVVDPGYSYEIILALDADTTPPGEKLTNGTAACVKVCYGPSGKKSHVSAMNAAIGRADGDMLAFLEDDDLWRPKRIEYGLWALESQNVDFVSCTQSEVTPAGEPAGRKFNDFPTCSGWLFRKDLLNRTGWFDDRFKIHWDNEFLGKLNMLGVKRLHFTEKGADRTRPWRVNVSKRSRVMDTHEAEPLVMRVVHHDSIMGTMTTNPERARRSGKEVAALEVLFGEVPW